MAALRPFRPATDGPPCVVPQRSFAPVDPAPTDPVLAAEAEAAAIIVAAEAERDRVLAEGYADGRAHAQAEIAEIRQALVSLTESLREESRRATQLLARDAALLATSLATEMVGAEVAARPERIATIAARILDLSPPERAEIRVHPGLVEHLPDLDVPVRADGALAPGDVVVAGPFGEIDARRAAIVEQVTDALRDADA